MNKRILDLLSGISGVLAMLAAVPFDKDTMQLIPVEWQPYVIRAGLLAALILKVLAFYAPPTPSPLPDQSQIKTKKLAQ
jgi:hypothetical protein